MNIKTKILLILLAAACLAGEGYKRRAGIDFDCPHDGKHGDHIIVTVEHNGKKAKREMATVYMLERHPQWVADLALDAFNDTKSK